MRTFGAISGALAMQTGGVVAEETITPTALDLKIQPQVKKILDDYGKEITFYQKSSTYNPSTGEGTVTETSKVEKCIPPYQVEKKFITGDIKSTDLMTGLVPQNWKPKLTDRAVIDGRDYSIMAVQPIYTGELIGLFLLVLRD